MKKLNNILKENMIRFATKNLNEQVTPNLANTEMFDITEMYFNTFVKRTDPSSDVIIMPEPRENAIYVLPNASKAFNSARKGLPEVFKIINP